MVIQELKDIGRRSVVDCIGAAAMVLAAGLFVQPLAGCSSGTAARRDSATGDVDSSLSPDLPANIFQGFNWLDDTCTTMLGGSANISVNDGSTNTDQCIAASACAMRGAWRGDFYLELGIRGSRTQGEPCQICLMLPLDSLGGISVHDYAFGSSLTGSPYDVIVLSYYGSGYYEYDGKDPNAYPSPDVADWTGTSTIESLPPVGGMIRGRFIYDGTDLVGAQRKVDATFSVPRYPDFIGVLVPNGGVR